MTCRVSLCAALAAISISLAAATSAVADPAPTLTNRTLRLGDESGRAIVHVRGVHPTGEPPRGSGARIEVDVAGDVVNAHLNVDNPLVKRVELSAGDTSHLTLLLHRDLKAPDIAALLLIDSDDEGLRITLPRAPEPILEAPAPALAAAETRGIAPLRSDPQPATPTEATGAAAIAAPALAPSPEPLPAPTPTAHAPAPVARPIAAGLADERPLDASPGPGGVALLGLLALLVIPGGLLLWKRRPRRIAPAYGDAIHIVATRSLGAKLRLVLLSVGEQRMLLSVSDSAAQTIGRWRQRDGEDPTSRDADESAMDRAMVHAPSVPELAYGHYSDAASAANAASADSKEDHRSTSRDVLAAAGFRPQSFVIDTRSLGAIVDDSTPEHREPPAAALAAPATATPSIAAAPAPMAPNALAAAPAAPLAHSPTESADRAREFAAALSALTAPLVSGTAHTMVMPLVALPDGPPASPAVAGILKLRGYNTVAALQQSSETSDAHPAAPAPAPAPNADQDAAWARELLAATRMTPSGTPSIANRARQSVNRGNGAAL